MPAPSSRLAGKGLVKDIEELPFLQSKEPREPLLNSDAECLISCHLMVSSACEGRGFSELFSWRTYLGLALPP